MLSFSLIITIIPEAVSISPWMASDMIARELEISPTMTLKTASDKFTKMAIEPALMTVWLWVVSGFVICYDFSMNLV